MRPVDHVLRDIAVALERAEKIRQEHDIPPENLTVVELNAVQLEALVSEIDRLQGRLNRRLRPAIVAKLSAQNDQSRAIWRDWLQEMDFETLDRLGKLAVKCCEMCQEPEDGMWDIADYYNHLSAWASLFMLNEEAERRVREENQGPDPEKG